jgi:transglutaminase-like putative cysteine protease
MKKLIKSALILGIALSVTIACLTGAAAAVTELGSRVYINTLYGSAPAVVKTAESTATADFAANDYASFVKTVEQQYILRNTSFTVKYIAGKTSLSTVIDTLLDDVFAYDDPATTSDLDYLQMNMKRWEVSGQIYSSLKNPYAIYKFTQVYLTTADQENYVNTSVETILNNLSLGTAGDYAKIKAVHDYILDNVDYDNTLSRFSAYDALSSGQAVCQGYALLTYKMLAELGVPVRFISGMTTQSADGHAWNIVKIGQLWYNYDVTWDDTSNDPTQYFLRNNAAFADHIRDAEFTTAAFNASFPMSAVDYAPGELIRAISFPQSGGIFSVGNIFTLTAVLTPANPGLKTLSWSSSDAAVAAVDQDGGVTVKSAGTAVITAEAKDGSGVSAAFTLTAVVTETPSAWAKAGVEALTARGIIPASLMSGWQSTITRAEFTALIMNIYEYARGPYILTGGTPFSDIAGIPFEMSVAKGFELGIINGIGDGAFSPDGSLTREQCAKIISTAAGIINESTVASTAELPYADAVTIDGWALLYVRYTFENGLMTGTDKGFEPLGILTREQAMLVAERMIEKYGW